MKLNNQLIIRGSRSEIQAIEQKIYELNNKKLTNDSPFHGIKTKSIKSLSIERNPLTPFESELKVSFIYKGKQIDSLINRFKSLPVEVIFYSENEKDKVWIVSQLDYIDEYKFIPEWAIKKILLDYMEYTESAIILDNFSTIQLDLNTNQLTINKKQPEKGTLLDIFFNQSINGKPLSQLLEQFTQSFYYQCINRYEDLYSSNEEKLEGERTTPFALFTVTFGIFAIIIILIYWMGYL